ncbi:MAG TPA: di-heme oxidoredictase family protein [Blastocatellia bacterium]|nr:di-heme oxidoredictase family protein [Blastocatellia bacterium]
MKALQTKLLKLSLLAIMTAAVALSSGRIAPAQNSVTEAPTGFDNLTNGLVDQATFDFDRTVFETHKTIADGLGPIYNGNSCSDCHRNPGPGGISQVTNLRAGHLNGTSFVEALGGSLISDLSTYPSIQERVPGGNEVRTFRTSLNTLGDGFVECIQGSTLQDISDSQPPSMRGQFIRVPVLESPGTLRPGRFGWKNQNASLMSACADEFLNQVGITNSLLTNENTSLGISVAAFDAVPDPEDHFIEGRPHGTDLEAITEFIRASKAPPRDFPLAVTQDAQMGENLFQQIGCVICHVRNIITAPPGTVINGGTFVVPVALGDKLIHPYSDFLLHDVGTGDGIVQSGGASTRNKLRTPPLWGMRTRDRLMHDGAALSRTDAILRHSGEATLVIHNFRNLSANQQSQLITFLNSL